MKNKKTLNKSYILSGPIGVGKTTVIELLKNEYKTLSELNPNDEIIKHIIKNTYAQNEKKLNPDVVQMYTFANRFLTFAINTPGIFDRGPVDPIVFDFLFNKKSMFLTFLDALKNKENTLKNTKHIILTLNEKENISRLEKRNRENEFINEKTIKLIKEFNYVLVGILIMCNWEFEIINCDDKTPQEIKQEIIRIIENDEGVKRNEKS